ncbi:MULTISPECIES: ferrochelatase [Gammaproteobacteria]|uniref:ferrochelatase n=1 Tax=Gammaproteobacteria TaxID=1236 RepID=UPI001ADD4962|nr:MULTISPECIES: ferrochelatase [Gammaproteobacteria]MBO9480069.1 ferrochelatase [Salinisphaera sp. G21_0]MBO9493340.1 ferrochelatase [Thalassotalea sp. G20_0]
MENRGVLLVNLGSPDSTSVEDVRNYLNEFLMDKHVIDLPWVIRRLILSLFILPSRPARSAEAYSAIWTEQGSPLIVNSEKCAEQLRERTSIPIELAMRYGKPDMAKALSNLAKQPGIEEILLFPLYPHYAMSSVKTVIERAKSLMQEMGITLPLRVHPVFYDHDGYIEALVESAKPWLEKEFDHLVFSYHGVPERHITKDDPTGNHCLKDKSCCQKTSIAHKTCYRHQVYQTTEAFVEKAGIPIDKYSVGFQSRLGKAKWLEPNTLDVLKQLADQGARKVLVICPSFVSDCLETLEEIGIGAKEEFIKAGGESLELIPCLNDHPAWIDLLKQWSEHPLTH